MIEFCFVWDRILPCRSGWPWTQDPLSSPTQVLWLDRFFKWVEIHITKSRVLKWITQWHSVHSVLCNHHRYLVPKQLNHPKENPVPINQLLPVSASPPPSYPRLFTSTNLHSASVDLPVLDSLCNGMLQYVWRLWCLASVTTIMLLRFIHFVTSNPLCVYTTYLSAYLLLCLVGGGSISGK